ncbi:MAG: alanine--glyoxylate aminotransferase family protein, partial [Clostridia bacterium]|nr:alanine--glyoxylate aminotransferase family protein [Clostridia bacterium]
MDDLLLIPGPVQVPPQVRQATAQPMINHRGPEFAALHREVTEALRPIFGTSHDILIFPSAGTGVMEAAIVNLFSPGERVLVCAMGEFGRRFAAIGRAFGLEVDVEEVEWGTAVTAERVAARLDATTYRGVLVTQNETSTGVALDLASVAAAVRGRGALLVVDAISALAGMPMEADRWGVDVVVAASQKALMTPPGLG